ncbi:hypothetical protein [Nocardioides marmorisolisilvae]|uniref:Uncharacterized protein n=1 Tax=Nocardioides marmorisolisilvae TaxID=1542737 RepID=A0A3N0DID6_9ACTN|nr:hypothetical protein [Nocardioides marmorisolisilvae]RNL75425.1 hypothetical protein EFL95_18620 [Nocardioides marmorisolisilvae]
MSPLQKIAMGLVIIFVPANFDIAHHVYDGLPDPLGWVLVVSGMSALRKHLDVDVAYWLAWVALAVSIPLWFPQLTEQLPDIPDHLRTAAELDQATKAASIAWALALPQSAMSLLLVRVIGQEAIAQEPRDVFVAGRFGVLLWGIGAAIVLPPIAYGGDVENLITPTLVGVGLVQAVLIYYLFRVHRREWLGGPGPLLIHPRPRKDEGRPTSE